MSAIAYQESWIGILPSSRSKPQSRPDAFDKDWAMLRHVGWMATIAVLTLLTWQAAVADPFWPRGNQRTTACRYQRSRRASGRRRFGRRVYVRSAAGQQGSSRSEPGIAGE